jgi:uncharacterized protein (DUF427 family)
VESVADYPRPPRVEPVAKRIEVVLGGVVVVESTRAVRVLETTHPPNYYVPIEDVLQGALEPSGGRTTFCEWKGVATYFDVVAGGVRAERAAWTYPDPSRGFEELRGRVSFYCAPFDACLVDGERAAPESRPYYGGWVTAEIRV